MWLNYVFALFFSGTNIFKHTETKITQVMLREAEIAASRWYCTNKYLYLFLYVHDKYTNIQNRVMRQKLQALTTDENYDEKIQIKWFYK